MAAVVAVVAQAQAAAVEEAALPQLPVRAVEAGLRQLAVLVLPAGLAPAGVAPVLSSARESDSMALLQMRGRQSFSAAMARMFPSQEQPTYERVPRSR